SSRASAKGTAWVEPTFRSANQFHAEPLISLLHCLTEVAPKRVRLAASMLYGGGDRRRLAGLRNLARHTQVPLIAVNNVLYHIPERRALQDVLTAIREHVCLDAAG